MKRLYLALLLALFVSTADARMTAMVVGGGEARCVTPTGSVMNESFGDDSVACYSGASGNDATCINTWVVSGDSVTFHHELQSGAPNGSCTYGLLSDTSNESSERIYWDIGSENVIPYTTSTDIVFSVYFNSVTVDNNSGIAFIKACENWNGTNVIASVFVYNSSGTYCMRPYGTGFGICVPLSNETWYDCRLHLDATAELSYFQVNGGGSTTCDVAGECTFTRANYNKRYIQIGSLTNEGDGEGLSFEIGYVYVNNP